MEEREKAYAELKVHFSTLKAKDKADWLLDAMLDTNRRLDGLTFQLQQAFTDIASNMQVLHQDMAKLQEQSNPTPSQEEVNRLILP